MNYLYTAESRLDVPHAYMYASYGGQDFITSYYTDRRSQLAQHLQGTSCPPHGNLTAALSTTARTLASSRALAEFSPADGVTLQPLLAALLGVLASGDVVIARPWLNRLVQRFEVSKKLYAVYAPGFRKGEDQARDPARYVELALCLSLAHALTGHLQYLRTHPKLLDLLLSLEAATLRPACLPERLALLVEAELTAVRILALAQGVTVDVP